MWDDRQVYQRFFSELVWKRNTPVTVPVGSGSNGSARQDAMKLFDRLLTQREADSS